MRVFIISILLFSFSGLFAQSGWDWGSDKITASRKYQYVQTYMNSKHYTECRPTVQWLLVNTPNLHSEFYKRASVVYKESVKVEKDPAQKIVLQDSLLWIYDTWIEKFGANQTPLLLNKKAKVYYSYHKGRKTTDLKEVQAFYHKVLTLNGVKTYSKNIKTYMAIALNREGKGQLTDEELLEAYRFSGTILTKQKEAKKGNAVSIAKIEKTEKILLHSLETASLTCEAIETYFRPLYKASPKDSDLATAISGLLAKNKCVGSAFYLEVMKNGTSQGGSSSKITYIADREFKNNHLDSAIFYYKKALTIETGQQQKSKIYYQLARIASRKGRKNEARTYAKKMIATGYQKVTAYNFIGDLYYNSGGQCKAKNEMLSRAVYISAYLQYQKAGNKKKMKLAKEQFPSMEDIFVQSKKIGDIVNTGCWINENVPLKKR